MGFLTFTTILFFILTVWFGIRCVVLSSANDYKDDLLERQSKQLKKNQVENSRLRKKVNSYKRVQKFINN